MDQDDAIDWTHKIVDLRDRRDFRRQADTAECARLSDVFGEAECRSLAANYTIVPFAPGRCRVSGSITARLELICGVTLDPIEQRIEEEFDIEFRSDARRSNDLELDFDAFGDDDPEPIEHGLIRVGRLICEIVASAIDPFPRADDAELEQTEVEAARSTNNPFAVLSQLKPDRKPN